MQTHLINGAVVSRAFSNSISKAAFRGACFLLGVIAAVAATSSNGQAQSILGGLGAPQVLSTVPSNGDLNPYGVAFVPPNFPTGGLLAAESGEVAVFVRDQVDGFAIGEILPLNSPGPV
jgi:hypothetical protein